jgi:ParB/RepB/Spo0J family partition protein
MKDYIALYKELPLEQIERDIDQPRKDFGVEGEENRLLLSMRQIGIQQPLVVQEAEKDRYIIIDGQRRYMCAKMLDIKILPCRVVTKLPKGELERLRFEIQNNRREWRPLEKSDALERIKDAKGFRTNRELATFLGMSEPAVCLSLKLRKQTMEYIGLMERYDLPETYRVEFLRLKPKLRKVRDLEVDAITRILFEKVKCGILKNAKTFRKLCRIFLRAHLNEKELYAFLTNPDMTVEELEKRTVQSGPSLLVEKLVSELGTVFQKGSKIAEQDKAQYIQLRDFLLSKFPVTAAA